MAAPKAADLGKSAGKNSLRRVRTGKTPLREKRAVFLIIVNGNHKRAVTLTSLIWRKGIGLQTASFNAIEERNMRPISVGCAMVASLSALLLQRDGWSASRPGPGPLYDYIATKAFADGAEKFYLEKVAANEKRAKMIAQAKDECGGRYESTAVNLMEPSHLIDTDKEPSGGPVDYTVAFPTKAQARWLVVETIACSMHGGHAQSVLHAALMSGVETQTVTYHFVKDRQVGKPIVTNLKRAYKIDSYELSDQYRVPYSEQ